MVRNGRTNRSEMDFTPTAELSSCNVQNVCSHLQPLSNVLYVMTSNALTVRISAISVLWFRANLYFVSLSVMSNWDGPCCPHNPNWRKKQTSRTWDKHVCTNTYFFIYSGWCIDCLGIQGRPMLTTKRSSCTLPMFLTRTMSPTDTQTSKTQLYAAMSGTTSDSLSFCSTQKALSRSPSSPAARIKDM